MHGQHHLDDILTHPNGTVKYRNHPRYGEVIDIKIPSSQGARFYQNGDFVGFLEP